MQHPNTGPSAQPRRRPSNAPTNPASGGAGGWGPPNGYTAKQGTIRPTDAHFFGGMRFANAYGCPLTGDCLSPEINDGDMGLASPTEEAQPGDFVVLYFTSGATPLMKRLVMPPMCPIGTKLHPDNDTMPIVMVEMLNPPRQLVITIDKLKAMHKVVGLIRKDEVAALRYLKPIPMVISKPPRRRKAGAA